MTTVHRPGSTLFVCNASEVMFPESDGPGVRRIAGHALFIKDGRIAWTGAQKDAPEAAKAAPHFDAGGQAVLPALVDCHTHILFGGDRTEDFSRRAQGVTYSEIAAAGGGIQTTVNSTRATALETLVARGRTHLTHRLHQGIVTTEIKSGYGLQVDTELRMLDAVDRLKNEGWDLEPTLLAAHAVPRDQDRASYLHDVVHTLIPKVAADGRARFVDVFVEQGAYTVDEARAVFEAGLRWGLIPKVHADQITESGGSALAAEINAASADHLERITASDRAALARKKVVGVLLPGALVYLGDHAPGLGRQLIDAGVEVAVATDFNPGSSPTHNLPLMATLACTLLGLTAEESLRAITRGAAQALRRPDIGHFDIGARGRFVVLNASDSRALVARFGEPTIQDVVLTES
ncbi:MAG: imidazolonepropionase [Myxococcota bacterium]